MRKYPCLLGIVVAACLFLPRSLSQRCQRIDQCRCETFDGSGIIDLNSLAVPADEAPKWTLEGGDGWLYSYNPCIGFDSIQFTNLAVLQQSNSSSEEYELGSQYYEDFSYSVAAGLAITYYSYDYLRATNVYLICTPGLTEHNLQFIGETIVTRYDFILESPCACPGMCDASGIINAPTEPDATTTPPGNTTGSCDCCNKNVPSYWDDVGADIVSLLLHDMILVFVIVCAILVMKFVFKKRLAFFVDDGDISFRPQESAQAASNHESANRTEAVMTVNIAPAPDMNFHNIENVYSNQE